MVAETPTPGVSRVITSSAVNGLCYAVAQGINFLVQLLLVHALGKSVFSSVGVAQICVLSLIFIGELGMPAYFIREASIRSNWRHQWYRGAMLRALTIGLGTVALLVFWRIHSPADAAGLHYILFAIPGMLLSVLNPTPLLIAQHRAHAAAGGLMVLWLTYAALVVGVVFLLSEQMAPGGIGAAFSLGYLAFTLVLHRRVQWEAPTNDPTAHAHRDMLKRSITVWIPALLGTLYMLLLTFSIQHVLPEILVYFLLGNQIMQGISGLNLQMQRVLLATLAHTHQREPGAASQLMCDLFALAGKIAFAMILGLFTLLCFTGFFTQDSLIPARMPDFNLMLAERLLGVMGSFLVTNLMAQHREFLIFRVTLVTYVISMVIQCVLTYFGVDLLVILTIRILTSLLQILIFYRALRCRLSPLPLFGMAWTVLIGFVPYSSASMVWMGILSALLSGGLCLLAWRHYRPLRHA